MVKAAASKELSSIVPVCYHCGVRKHNLAECEIWGGVKVCNACVSSIHKAHHERCVKDVESKEGLQANSRAVRNTFKLLLTHYTGRSIAFDCRPGITMRLEDHWAGTYIYFASTMVLVLEDRSEINEAIISGLKTLSV